MYSLFDELWEKLPKPRKCWSCDKKITGQNLSVYWDHLLEREFYPEFTLEERNLYFCCLKCHDSKTKGFPTEEHKQAIERAKKELLDI